MACHKPGRACEEAVDHGLILKGFCQGYQPGLCINHTPYLGYVPIYTIYVVPVPSTDIYDT